MFGGEFLTSFVPEVGIQERMQEHGKEPLWKMKYVPNLALKKFKLYWPRSTPAITDSLLLQTPRHYGQLVITDIPPLRTVANYPAKVAHV